MTWTATQTAELQRLWAEGLTVTRIAEQLGEGVTRNMVIGKAHRLKFAARPNPSVARKPRTVPPKPPAKPRQETAQADAPIPAAIAEAMEARAVQHVPARLLTIFELRPNNCRWPNGDPRLPGFGFCGEPVLEGRTYCGCHYARSVGRS